MLLGLRNILLLTFSAEQVCPRFEVSKLVISLARVDETPGHERTFFGSTKIGIMLHLLLFLLAPPAAPAGDEFHKLLAQEWNYELESSPESATAWGDPRFNDRLSDYSPAGAARDLKRQQDFARRFEGIAPGALTPADQLNRQLILQRLRTRIGELERKVWEMPVDQMNGVQLSLAQLPSNTTFRSLKDYEDYLSRLLKIPQALEQVETTLRAGMRDRLMPPRYLLEKAAGQTEDIAKAVPGKSPFAEPLKDFPAQITAPDRERLEKSIKQAIASDVSPAYAKLARFLRDTYVPAGRKDPGIWAVPGGDEYYRGEIAVMTTTTLSPDEFHAIGLKQVEEITGQMLALAKRLGYQDLKSLDRAIAGNPKLHGTSGEQILQLYRQHTEDMKARMPQLFGRQPKAPLAVVPMDSFRAPSAVPADYSPGSPDGTRPGRINVNEYAPTKRLLLNVEAIAYHEGIPGHHQQIALAQELSGLPEFRRHANYNAYTEGWALYAERLAKEVGLYTDPYSEYGRLQNEMWRAVRLVVDTGVHAKHWSRRQMIDFFHAHTAMDDLNINTEVDRYIAWPAQALGYKAGQIKILELRERARKALGKRFDLRAFHDAVLGEGALPLDVLDARIDAWIRRRQGS